MREEGRRNEQALKMHKRNKSGKGSKRGVEYVSSFPERVYTYINMSERIEVL